MGMLAMFVAFEGGKDLDRLFVLRFLVGLVELDFCCAVDCVGNIAGSVSVGNIGVRVVVSVVVRLDLVSIDLFLVENGDGCCLVGVFTGCVIRSNNPKNSIVY